MPSASRPNILVLMTDDHGQWAAGCSGSPHLHTPSMDELAQRGARMANASTPCPVCSPARASFWTGRIPSAHGIHDWINERGIGGQHPGIAGQRHLGERLQSAGYRTAMVGKWHCQAPWRHWPGFDYWYSLAHGTEARFGEHTFCDHGETVLQHGHQAPMLTDAAIRFLKQHDPQNEQPWFLFVGYTNTHSPFSSEPERLANYYRRCEFGVPFDEPFADCHGHAMRHSSPDPAIQHEQQAQYHAAVEMIDEQLGRLLDVLEDRGETDHTLAVYTSDHGHMNGQHGLWCKGNATTPQNFLDESIRVPCFIRWPDTIKPGQVVTQPVDHCDLHAALLDAAGYQPDASDTPFADRPGQSYLPLLTNDDAPWRDAQFCEYANARMIRTARYKLIRRYPGPNGRFPDELYDLENDPRETVNVIGEPKHEDVIAHLTARLEAYFDAHGLPSVSGLRVADLPRLNDNEPWRRGTQGATAY